jgi:hypothetical protein
MQTALTFSRAIHFSPVAFFFPEQNKPLHVFLNGANLAPCCGAPFFAGAENPTGSD